MCAPFYAHTGCNSARISASKDPKLRLISGVVFGYLSDILGFRSNSENNQENDIKDQRIRPKQNTLASIFIENVGFYTIIVMAIFLAPGSIMALWGGSIDVISSLTYWVSVMLTVICMIF